MPDIAPWIKPAEPAQYYQQAFNSSAEVAMAQQRLQQQAAELEMRREAVEKEAEQRRLIEQQKNEIETAYRRAQLGIQAERLEETRKSNEFKTMQAAQQFSSRQRMGQRIANKEDPFRVMLEEGPQSGWTGAQMAPVARASQATIPEALVTQKQDGRDFVQRKGSWYPVAATSEDKGIDDAIRHSQDIIKARMPYVVLPNKKIKEEAQEVIDTEKRRIDGYRQKQGKEPLYPEAAPLPLPRAKDMNELKKMLTVGKLYQTSRGVARWDGKMFIPE